MFGLNITQMRDDTGGSYMPNTLDTSFVNELSKSYINGKGVEGNSGKNYDIKDPYDDSVFASVKLADQKQIQEAFLTLFTFLIRFVKSIIN